MATERNLCFGTLPVFNPGVITVSALAAQRVSYENILPAINKHVVGDWRAMSSRQRSANKKALELGGKIISCCVAPSGDRFQIITNAKRSKTEVILDMEVGQVSKRK